MRVKARGVDKMEGLSEKNASKFKTRELVYIAMFTAVLAVIAQFKIPTPFGIPVTLQVFGVALIGIVLGWKRGLASVAMYLFLGAIGIPVFAGGSAGFACLIGPTGGYLWGYLILVALCGTKWNQKKPVIGMISIFVGVIACYLLGATQYKFVGNLEWLVCVIGAFAPQYFVKDLIMVVVSFVVGKQIRGQLIKANLLDA